MSIPDPGQVVEVRSCLWVVDNVTMSVFVSDVIGKQHFVDLTLLEQDSPGETLQVVWELESGSWILEKAGFPSADGLDDLNIGHNFHKTKHGVRYSMNEFSRCSILDRLLELNHQRYQEEVKAGLQYNQKKKANFSGVVQRR